MFNILGLFINRVYYIIIAQVLCLLIKEDLRIQRASFFLKGGKNNMCEAIKELMEEEKFNLLCDLVKENIITIEIAAQRMHISVDEFVKKWKKVDNKQVAM